MSDSSVEHRDSTKASSSSGVSSDCSDSDHEIEDHKTVFEYHIEASTQTASLEEQKSELTYLTLEIEKLTKFKHRIENNDDKENVSKDNPDQMALEELDDLRVKGIIRITMITYFSNNFQHFRLNAKNLSLENIVWKVSWRIIKEKSLS